MNNYFFCDASGKEIGPLTLDALAKLRFAGVLNGDTLVRAAETTEWKPCREIIADLPQISSLTTPASAVSGRRRKKCRRQSKSALCSAYQTKLSCPADAGHDNEENAPHPPRARVNGCTGCADGCGVSPAATELRNEEQF